MTHSNALRRAIAGALLLGLCACGGSGDPAPAAASPGSGASPAASVDDSSTDDSSTKKSDTGSAPAAELCAFLTQEVPKLKAVGPGGTGAAGLANFSLDFGSWIEEDPDQRTLKRAEDMDTISTANCPKARDEILAILEKPSFAKAFGG